MSKLINNRVEFQLDDVISFDHEGSRLTGKVTRVYNTHDLYHVQVGENTYQVSYEDNPARVEKKNFYMPISLWVDALSPEEVKSLADIIRHNLYQVIDDYDVTIEYHTDCIEER